MRQPGFTQFATMIPTLSYKEDYPLEVLALLWNEKDQNTGSFSGYKGVGTPLGIQ